MLRRRRHLCVIVCSVEGELPVYPLYSKKGLICFVRVCVFFCRHWLGFVWGRHVKSEIISCLCHSAPRPILLVRYICCASRRPGQKVRWLQQLCTFGTFFCSPAVLPSPLRPPPPSLTFLSSHEFDFSPLFGSRPVFRRPSALPPSVHTCARFHPPCLFSSAGSTLQPTLKRRSSLWLYCHRIGAHVACRFPPPLLLPRQKKKAPIKGWILFSEEAG